MAREADVDMIVTIDVAACSIISAGLAAQGLFKRVIVCSAGRRAAGAEGLALRLFGRKSLARVPDQAAYIEFRALIAGPPTPAPVAIDPVRDMAVLQFTGGTTGTPKAAMLSHANVTANVQQASS